MKRLYFLTIVLFTLVLSGCKNDAVLFDGPTFLEFINSTDKLLVKDTDTGILEIEVGISNKTKEDMTINIVVDETKSTAVEGRDFSFVTKTVTIPAGQNIGKFSIKANYDNLTPEGVVLVIKMDVDASLIQEAIGNEMTINLSRFFEVSMEWLTGNWKAQDNYKGADDGEPYDVVIEEVDETHIIFWGLAGAEEGIEAKVDWDNSQIIIDWGQYVFTHQELGHCFIFNVVGSSLINAPIQCEITYKGIVTGSYGILNQEYSGWFPFFTTLTKPE